VKWPGWRTVGTILHGAGAVVFGVVAYMWLTLPDVRPLATSDPKSTAFMRLRAAEARRDGRKLRFVQHWVNYEQISPSLIRAVRLAEDAAFFQHEGLDYDELRSAFETNWTRFELTRGASTITQQLAKNLYLSPSRNPCRKIAEIFIARRLEAELPKRRIFELYLNLIEWGDGVWGAEAAARTYFGTSAGRLNAEQSALLAGAIINPRVYSPARPNSRLLRRQQIILRRMNSTPDGTRSEHPPDAHQLGAPVRRVEVLDADRAAGAWRVHELAGIRGTERDPDVRRAFRGCREEEQVTGLHVSRLNFLPDGVLLRNSAGQLDLILLEHEPHETTAIES
jgi:monofunctional biosynthetic peptidoglycan transglycosylase